MIVDTPGYSALLAGGFGTGDTKPPKVATEDYREDVRHLKIIESLTLEENLSAGNSALPNHLNHVPQCLIHTSHRDLQGW